MSALKLTNVHLKLDDTPVLDGVSMHVQPGEFVSLLGPSGAGKSTIFRLLTGEVVHDAGSISVDGQALGEAKPAFAFMPQRDALMPWRRILDNMTLGLEVQGMGRAQARAQVMPLLDEFGLAGFERHYPGQLSGGMRQRAALLRTVVQGCSIQLLDEPFGALDALTRTQMQNWFEARWHEARWTTLLVTHDVREAVALSDRIYVLSSRPAKVIAEMAVPARRPRLAEPIGEAAHALEAELLDILFNHTGAF